MPRFFGGLFRSKDTLSVNRYEGFTNTGAIVLRDRRGTRKSRHPRRKPRSLGAQRRCFAIWRPIGSSSSRLMLPCRPTARCTSRNPAAAARRRGWRPSQLQRVPRRHCRRQSRRGLVSDHDPADIDIQRRHPRPRQERDVRVRDDNPEPKPSNRHPTGLGHKVAMAVERANNVDAAM
jgi:hypothetical protein